MNPTEHTISVREIAEFVHRRGDLGGEGQFQRRNRAVEGIKGHQRIQKSRGPEYRPEVSIEGIFSQSGVQLKVQGRIDGLVDGLVPHLEEIKTVESRWSKEANPVHWAQVRLYAGLLTLQKECAEFSLQLTYLELESDQMTVFRQEISREEASAFLHETINEWFTWLVPQVEWIQQRNASIGTVPFPFDPFRKGQRELSISVYRAIRDRHHLFVEAPTGMGKTLATLFPAIKALPLLEDGKIFYATAKGSGRWTAEEGAERLRQSGLRLRSLSLTAKSKICFSEQPSGCDPTTCPFTKGYYDRVKPALRELLAFEHLDQATLQATAQKHQVCPFELSLDASLWVDLIIGDYNYIFDPTVMLQRFFSEGKAKHIALVDEAHNLVDRSREMYSATLSNAALSLPPEVTSGLSNRRAKGVLAQTKLDLEDLFKTAAEGIIPAKNHHRGAWAITELPEEFLLALEKATQEIELYLVKEQDRDKHIPWLEPWFAIHRFLRTAVLFDDSYRVIIDPTKGSITLFCVDPSLRLRETLKGLRSVVFFSATLSPIDYFFDLLGGSASDRKAIFPSPFRPEQMSVRTVPLDLSFQARDQSLDAVALEIQNHIHRMPGNHLIFCPSMAYLDQLQSKLTDLGISVESQISSMNEGDREKFLQRFKSETPIIGLAVMGGIFAEGVDLPGNQLVGVTVIGVGLPGLSIERDLLVAYFDQKSKPGFDYSYRFPGIQRVLQAVGRLIRSEKDRGNVLLMDKRYFERRYQRFFPEAWTKNRTE